MWGIFQLWCYLMLDAAVGVAELLSAHGVPAPFAITAAAACIVASTAASAPLMRQFAQEGF